VNRPAFITAALVLAAGSLWTVSLAVDPDPFSGDAAAAVGIGVVVFTLVGVSGILLIRGRWVPRFVVVLLAGFAGLAAAKPLEPWSIAALTATAAGAVAILGPWLRGWFRQRPAAGTAPWQASALGAAAVALVPVVGVASPAGLELAHGVLAGTGLFFGWAYVRTHIWALWVLRIATVPVGIAAAVASPALGAAVIAFAVVGITTLAWTREAALAVRPLMDATPGPRRAAPKQDAGP
jgi:hypothetical protein